jgi:hypothetical protein
VSKPVNDHIDKNEWKPTTHLFCAVSQQSDSGMAQCVPDAKPLLPSPDGFIGRKGERKRRLFTFCAIDNQGSNFSSIRQIYRFKTHFTHNIRR